MQLAEEQNQRKQSQRRRRSLKASSLSSALLFLFAIAAWRRPSGVPLVIFSGYSVSLMLPTMLDSPIWLDIVWVLTDMLVFSVVALCYQNKLVMFCLLTMIVLGTAGMIDSSNFIYIFATPIIHAANILMLCSFLFPEKLNQMFFTTGQKRNAPSNLHSRITV